jgi:hypothetical protein
MDQATVYSQLGEHSHDSAICYQYNVSRISRPCGAAATDDFGTYIAHEDL